MHMQVACERLSDPAIAAQRATANWMRLAPLVTREDRVPLQIAASAPANAVCKAMFAEVRNELLERVQACFERSLAANESFLTAKGEFDYKVARYSSFALGQQWLNVLVRFAPSLAHLTALFAGIGLDGGAASSSSSASASASEAAAAAARSLELVQDSVAFRVGGAAGSVSRAYPLHSFQQVGYLTHSRFQP